MQARGMWSADRGDDDERFLADLRALRDTAALGDDELAARAHYPSDILKAAENGPSLPGLPILAAYVRACHGDVPEWEERWRGLGYEVRADRGLPVRPAGASPAAVAGARAGIGIAPPDVHDPERIRAALRSRHGYSDRAAAAAARQETAGVSHTDPAAQAVGAGGDWEAGSGTGIAAGWDSGSQRRDDAIRDTAAEQVGTVANGNHQVKHRGPALFDAAVTEATDHAGSPEATRRDPYSASWAQDSQPATPSDSGSGWPDPAQAESPPASQDAWRTSQDPADSERTWRLDTGLVSPDPGERGPAARGEEGGLTSPEPADFWRPSDAAATPADIQRPGHPLPPAEEQPVPLDSWPAPAGNGSSTASDPAPPSESRRDRLYPLRLLVVIVVAALIGSILVMLIR